MGKTLLNLTPITTPATIESNANLLADVAALEALDPKELFALGVYCRLAELYATGNHQYDPTDATKLGAFVQDAHTVFGSIPVGDLPRAMVAIDWDNANNEGAALSSDVDALTVLSGFYFLRTYSLDELKRMAAYLRLEINI